MFYFILLCKSKIALDFGFAAYVQTEPDHSKFGWNYTLCKWAKDTGTKPQWLWKRLGIVAVTRIQAQSVMSSPRTGMGAHASQSVCIPKETCLRSQKWPLALKSAHCLLSFSECISPLYNIDHWQITPVSKVTAFYK